jgi:VanZ family protein
MLFVLLALLVRASRLPLRRGTLVGLLVGYAIVTESLQVFVPTRTVELLDFVENLIGLAAGWGLWRLIETRFFTRTSTPGGDP